MQVKLLRVLQEKMFTPVGANREIESNVRIIAATNRPLEEMNKKGTFREDLYYRLNVMPINLPSLSERKGDIDHLVNLFIQKFNRAQNKKVVGVTPEALAVLKKYEWPGNIRELENIMEHAFILEESNMVQVSSLPESILNATGTELSAAQLKAREEMLAHGAVEDIGHDEPAGGEDSEPIGSEEMVKISGDSLDFNKHKEAFEKEFIVKALKMFKGRINQTALHANIPKKTLLRKIEKYGINAKDYV
jgi:two-component system, NtrC family, response regulator HydG